MDATHKQAGYSTVSPFQRALAAGASPVQAPVQKEDEDKRGGVRDAGGTTWWIATRVG